ncbi:MAG: hypothetical protein JWR80_158 [Bradyrhizobium sp.]|nr:hypothetical protein [Bradyrhizobium sp.]
MAKEPTLYARMELSLSEAEKRLAKFNAGLDRTMGTMERRTAKAAATMQASLANSAKSWAGNISTNAIAAGIAMISFAAVIGKTKDALNEFGDIADKSAQAGLDPEFFQEIAYQASLAGVGMDELSGSLATFNKNSGLAVVGKGKMVQALKALNPELLENIRNSKSQEERVKLVADAIDKEADASRKAAIASAAFGDVGTKLVSVFQGGAAAIEQTAIKARELGIIVDRDLIARADALGDEFDTATKVIDIQFKQALVNLAPILTATAGLIADITSGISQFIDSMRAYENQTSHLLNLQLFQIGQQRLDLENKILEKQQEQRDEAEKLSATARDLGFKDTLNPALSGQSEIEDLKAQNEELGKKAELITNVMNARNKDAAAVAGSKSGDHGDDQVKLPPLTTPSSSPTRNKAADDAIRQAEAVKDLIDNLEFERTLVGKTEVEQAKMNALRQAGAAATTEQKDQIASLIEQTAREKAAVDAVNKSMQESAALGKDVFGGIIQGMRDGASAGDILTGVLDKITSKLIDMQLDALFTGTGSTPGPLGGLFAPLLNLFNPSPTSYFPPAPTAANVNVSSAQGLRMPRIPQAQAARASGAAVVVHNYADATVRTEEKRDPRGGVRQEIIIEKATASAITRPGSSAGQALRSNFGVSPRLIKR